MDFGAILPAALLALGLLGVLITDLIGKGRQPEVPVIVALASLAAAAIASLFGDTSDEVVLGVLKVDGFGVTFTVFCCVTGFFTILATMRGEAFRRPGGEFLVLILSAVLGMSILPQSVDLVTLYLAFETVSIRASRPLRMTTGAWVVSHMVSCSARASQSATMPRFSMAAAVPRS